MTCMAFYLVYNMSDRLCYLVEYCLLQLIFVFSFISLSQVVNNKQWIWNAVNKIKLVIFHSFLLFAASS